MSADKSASSTQVQQLESTQSRFSVQLRIFLCNQFHLATASNFSPSDWEYTFKWLPDSCQLVSRPA